MHSNQTDTGAAGPVSHPEPAEWMAFLYEELAPERRRELGRHLAHCPACAGQVKQWRSGMHALQEWKLPPVRPARLHWAPALKWAAAAAMVLALGFVLGRQTVPAKAELAALRAAVSGLAELVESDRAANFNNSIAAATQAANTETVRLLTEYARLQEDQRGADQQTMKVALESFDSRLARLRSELETVAVNTETGFEQTHQNLTRLASLSVPYNNPATPFNEKVK